MSPRQWKPGLEVAGLVLREKVGQGGMGVVFLATDPASGASYAIKALSSTASPALLERFRREGQAQARADGHPNVLRVRSSGEAFGCLYLVMDHAPGGDLHQRLRHGAIPPRQAAQLVAQLAHGLQHVHGQGILHRDLKPSNVLFDASGAPQLVDFGIARLRGEQRLTITGEMIGTPAYMSPEQVDGRKQLIDERTDVYGLGAILYHCLAGTAPYVGETTNIIAKVVTEPPPRLRTVLPDAPKALEAICTRAMARSPGDRYPTAASLAEALEGYLATKDEPQAPRRFPLLVAILVLVLGVVAVGGAVAVRSTTDADVASEPAEPERVPEVRLARAPRTVHEPRLTLEGRVFRNPEWLEVQRGSEEPRDVTLTGREFAVPVELLPGPNTFRLTPVSSLGKRGPAATVKITYSLLKQGEREGEAINAVDGSVLIRIPAGTFLMGSEDEDFPEPSRPRSNFAGPRYTPHQVTITRPYYLGKYEVTWAQYSAFARATGHPLPRRPSHAGDDHPVSGVTWEDARAYCAWARVRLPTEAEWAFAGRGADARRHVWGNQLMDAAGGRVLRGNFSPAIKQVYDDRYEGTSPVGSFPAGASPFGCLDMAGNVLEWVQDAYADFGPEPQEDPCVLSGDRRVLRGGDFDRGLHQQRACYRFDEPPTVRWERVGFRVARDAD